MQNRTRSFTLAIIILSIFIFGLVSLRNSAQKSEFSTVQSDEEATTTTLAPTAEADEEVLGAVTTVAERKIQIFIDKDKDMARGANEGGCDVCIAKSLIVTSQAGVSEPAVAQLALANISGNGVVSETDLLGHNKAWGFFDDRKILIPQQNLVLGDAAHDIDIYAFQVNLIISGVNANLRDITVTDGNTATYEFNSLVSTLRTAQTNGTEVWVQFIPDQQNPGIYYLARGKILTDAGGQVTDVPGSHYMTINWSFDSGFATLTRAENLSFILL